MYYLYIYLNLKYLKYSTLKKVFYKFSLKNNIQLKSFIFSSN